MIASLRESKARLSEMVERASRGEDVLITVRGEVKARLTKAGLPEGHPDLGNWGRELARLQRQYATGRRNAPVDDILREDRGE
jgi:prevent-host-death family protein